jgi:hypothetical protein
LTDGAHLGHVFDIFNNVLYDIDTEFQVEVLVFFDGFTDRQGLSFSHRKEIETGMSTQVVGYSHAGGTINVFTSGRLAVEGSMAIYRRGKLHPRKIMIDYCHTYESRSRCGVADLFGGF